MIRQEINIDVKARASQVPFSQVAKVVINIRSFLKKVLCYQL